MGELYNAFAHDKDINVRSYQTQRDSDGMLNCLQLNQRWDLDSQVVLNGWRF